MFMSPKTLPTQPKDHPLLGHRQLVSFQRVGAPYPMIILCHAQLVSFLADKCSQSISLAALRNCHLIN